VEKIMLTQLRSRQLSYIFLAVLLAFGNLLLIASITFAKPTGTIIVNPGQSIQAAINAANPGDTIVINAGTFTESLTLSKAVSLTGINNTTVIVNALSNQRVLTVSGAAINNTIIISGFTVANGNVTGGTTCPEYCGGGILIANSAQPSIQNMTVSNNSASFGGGIYSTQSSPTLINIFFTGNTSSYNGAGMYIAGGKPSLTNTVFDTNVASSSGGMGGGMLIEESNPSLTNVVFHGNSASSGGGLYDGYEGNPKLINVTFSNNLAGYGGGMYNYAYNATTLVNVTFISNTATSFWGGGMINQYHCTPTLINVTFIGNSAVNVGGGLWNDSTSKVLVMNSILWGNTANSAAQIYSSGPITVTYSDIQGGYAGAGNLNVDPLVGTLGNYGGYVETVPLLDASPAINAGNMSGCSSTDARGVIRPQGSGCDLGAYEYITFTARIYLPSVRR
jgi:predicted outer membrane repeat protein